MILQEFQMSELNLVEEISTSGEKHLFSGKMQIFPIGGDDGDDDGGDGESSHPEYISH